MKNDSMCRAMVVSLAGLVPLLAGAAPGTDVRDLSIGFGDWHVLARQSTLPDTSVLTEYAAETMASGQASVKLRVGFIPRFACATLITVELGPIPTDRQSGDAAADAVASTLSWEFDGVAVEHASLIDEDAAFLSVYIDEDESVRNALRLNIDASNTLTVNDSGAMVVDFSLSGSRRSIEAAEQQCRQHEPVGQ